MKSSNELKISNKVSHIIVGCFLVAVAICVAQIMGNSSLLLLCLFGYTCFTIWTSDIGMSFPVLLFFLPWSPLLKLRNGGISFFTIALLITCLVAFVKKKISIKLYQFICPALLMGLTLISKAIQGNSINKSYLLFIVMLALFPCVVKECEEKISFKTCTFFFALGIISAALTAQQVAFYPNISKYITVDSYLTITRLSGFYGDPNFYSAHVTACLAGIQLMLCFEKQRFPKIILEILSVILLYCGMLSASKSFIIVLACLFLFWIPLVLRNGSLNSKVQIIIGVLIAGLIIGSSSLFQALFRIIDTRFADRSTMSDFTTGRTVLWKNYIHELLHNIPLLLFGQGYSGVVLNRKASHNSIIQLFYQFGVIGVPMLVAWLMKTFYRSMPVNNKGKIDWRYAALMWIGVALPWMGIDIVFFDEFFLLPVFAIIGIMYAAKEQGQSIFYSEQ